MNLHAAGTTTHEGPGIIVEEFDASTPTAEACAKLRRLIYEKKIVILRGQRLSPAQFVDFGRLMGEIEVYYQKMYHHPEHREIFVSSNVKKNGEQVGVPQTGMFWHSDYCFMPRPFGITLVHPQVVPPTNRGTYFIDMGRAYADLTPDRKSAIQGTHALHSPRRYVKIRPEDVYRPVGEILDDIERETPPVAHPTTFEHPVTGERILYICAAATYQINDAEGRPIDGDVLPELLRSSGQFDDTFTHPGIHLQRFEAGDLLMWDNRSLIHRARHSERPQPTVSHRITVHDEYGFFGSEGDGSGTP